MGVDMRVRRAGSRDLVGPALTLVDDGYYRFLHPWFERLRGQSGKYIDLYGDTQLTRDDFPRLRALLAEAALMASRQPATWQVQVGTQLHPVEKELYRTVVRRDLLDLIAKLEAMVDAAETVDGYIECLGD